ncbi:ABC transporter permease [Pseudooceanicola sediminis]|uniref:ABC transporter permease n=1 Tax=Pseudooceanicola sediminis TaxID=2211117 RepID=A0A399J2S7_9RHOB|nr:ABC transporter permease [Pseudooceanicola sediminis]KAA2317301.1 ABC transporter permease [Puniceibacterium sp. HSS470]RII39655.1 ABC transporter permease [Pseudooceanicola sediminis]|tara:strand:+ start:37096 stop:37956 length:861 start_codon:yes stop_codon:yes gene_type:complete
MKLNPKAVSLLQVAPMGIIFTAMVLVPLLIIIVVSFLDYDFARVFPEIYLGSWQDVLTSQLTLDLYETTFKFVAIVWVITFSLGFSIAYFLVFHVRTLQIRLMLLAAIAIPFWTSGPIRAVAWVPLLGREGLVNQALLGLGIVDQPVAWLMYSEFAILVAYIHLLTMPMVITISNSMMKIPGSIIQAAQDAGASEFQIIREIILPLARPGIAIGTIFVVTAVMGDFFIVKTMSGGQVNTATMAIVTELNAFQYPPAAAKSVLMLAIVLGLVALLLRFADIRKELTK